MESPTNPTTDFTQAKRMPKTAAPSTSPTREHGAFAAPTNSLAATSPALIGYTKRMGGRYMKSMHATFHLLFVLALLLGGCATEWRRHNTAADNVRADHPHRPSTLRLHTVQGSTQPDEGLTPITEADLLPGDILFSAEKTLVSTSIRLLNHAPVSHAFLYLGDGQIAEAVKTGVQIRPLAEVLRQTSLAVAFRRPDLQAADIDKIRAIAQRMQGSRYNMLGIVKQAPYSISRHACELPVIPRTVCHMCLNALAAVQITPFSSQRYFCSQFVIEAFNQAGKPLTKAPPEWLNPNDILCMREGDVPATAPIARLNYIGHLQCSGSPWNGICRIADSHAAPPTMPL